MSSLSSKESRKSSHEGSPTLRPEPDVEQQRAIEDLPPQHEKELGEQTPVFDDWNGPDDPENPWNWPFWKRCYHTFIPSGIALVCTLASSIYVPGREDVMQNLGASQIVAILPYSIYVLALAVGPMLAGPSSEVLGRKAVYMLSLIHI